MDFTKEDYHKIISLYSTQNWLIHKESELHELITFCRRSKAKDLIYSLLERFRYLQIDYLNLLLNEIADYIINKSDFEYEKIQILSFTFDDRPDSSQKVLDMIKIPLYKKGWHNPELVNSFKAFQKYRDKGRTQILMVDEFIGSGTTLLSRAKELAKSIRGPFELKFCFLAGIRATIHELQDRGFEIFCPLQLERGITDFYRDEDLTVMTDEMLFLESILAPRINDKDLSTYSFGYGKAEALYSLEGCYGNTPNSVFPIFWWIKDIHNNKRNTLLTRFEFGF